MDDLQGALDDVLTPALAANARKGIADAHFARGAYRQARAAYYDVVEHSSAHVETDRMLFLAAVCDLRPELSLKCSDFGRQLDEFARLVERRG